MGNYASSDNTLMFHLIVLTVSWNVLTNVAVYCALYKYTIKGYYIHIILSWLVVIITAIATLLYIIPKGIPQQCHISKKVDCDEYQFPLAIEGTILTFWLILQVFTGIFARAWQENSKATSLAVINSKRVHQFSGYFIMLLGKVNCFIHWREVPGVWIPLLVWQVFSIAVYVKRKWFFTSFQQKIVDNKALQSNEEIQKVKYIEELGKGKSQYAIFADHVYDISPLKTLHPAGYEIIDVTKGREVDRFIYGMYSAEALPKIKPFSHPANSFRLLGSPVAKICNPCPYSDMDELNECHISYKELVSSQSQIFIFGLSSSTDKPYTFEGYTRLSQIGQYFSLTHQDKVTRLYTTVNCLLRENRKIMQKIVDKFPLKGFNYEILSQESNYGTKKKSKESQQDNVVTSKVLIQGPQGYKKHSMIPLMIKIYQNGKLTPQLIKTDDQQQNMTISRTRGQGLKLDTLSPGKLVFICGGTGFYPFMDLVDLLFKSKMLNSATLKDKLQTKILDFSPLLQDDQTLNSFSYHFYIALNSAQDILPMTLYQLNYLSSFSQFSCTIKIRGNIESFKKIYTNFDYTNTRFDEIVLPEVTSRETSKTYVCGPPVMLTSLVNLFNENKVDQNSYQFV